MIAKAGMHLGNGIVAASAESNARYSTNNLSVVYQVRHGLLKQTQVAVFFSNRKGKSMQRITVPLEENVRHDLAVALKEQTVILQQQHSSGQQASGQPTNEPCFSLETAARIRIFNPLNYVISHFFVAQRPSDNQAFDRQKSHEKTSATCFKNLVRADLPYDQFQPPVVPLFCQDFQLQLFSFEKIPLQVKDRFR